MKISYLSSDHLRSNEAFSQRVRGTVLGSCVSANSGHYLIQQHVFERPEASNLTPAAGIRQNYDYSVLHQTSRNRSTAHSRGLRYESLRHGRKSSGYSLPVWRDASSQMNRTTECAQRLFASCHHSTCITTCASAISPNLCSMLETTKPSFISTSFKGALTTLQNSPCDLTFRGFV